MDPPGHLATQERADLNFGCRQTQVSNGTTSSVPAERLSISTLATIAIEDLDWLRTGYRVGARDVCRQFTPRYRGGYVDSKDVLVAFVRAATISMCLESMSK